MITENLLKYWKEEAMILLTILGFAAGRYTMRTSTEEELSATYKAQYEEQLKSVQVEYQNNLLRIQTDYQQQLAQSKSKNKTTDTTTITKTDGTKIVQQHTSDKENSKTASSSQSQKTSTSETSDSKSTKQQSTTQSQVQQTVSETKTVTPPASWRVYGVAAITSPTDRRDPTYGLGAMYDFGPLNVGVLGLYCTPTRDTTAGVTFGISF